MSKEKRKRCLIIKNKFETKANEYETKGNVTHLKLSKKDGKIIDAKIDTEDLKLVLDKGTWFAEWNKEFSNYLVQNITYTSINGKNVKEKLSLHSFILGAHPKAPIRHFNGDTLDNRRCNIEIFDQHMINDYEQLDSETAAIILRDKYGREKSRTLVDNEDLDKLINTGYTWVYYRTKGEHYAVANSPNGRVYLHEFIMNVPEGMVAKHVDHNPLNNKKSNLTVVEIPVEEPEEIPES